MQKLASSKPSTTSAARPHLPDPATAGPYRPFTTDPHWNEAWWWLGLPLLVFILLIVTYRLAPDIYAEWIIPEGYGVLEFSQFVIMLIGLALSIRLLFKPFVRRRPFVLAVTIIGALACLYIAGEEMSWGQHFFHWSTPEYWAEVNRQEETNLHNTYAIFEKWPRAILELGILIGGILIPAAAAFDPRIRANRLSLFLPAAALIPTAVAALGIKLADLLGQKGYAGELMQRPSEAIEIYLYFFILAFLIVLERRIRELETEDAGHASWDLRR
jgi:disulfide bond formation protein DsbB